VLHNDTIATMSDMSLGFIVELGHYPKQRSSIDLPEAHDAKAKEELCHRIVTLSDTMSEEYNRMNGCLFVHCAC
jgi:hypothetical protein